MRSPSKAHEDISVHLKSFLYGPFYITTIQQVGGNNTNASAMKTGETNMLSTITLNSTAESTAVFNVTFYNSTTTSYYYNETQTVSSNNERIEYSVSNIEKREEVPSKTYKTITLTYSFKNGVSTNKSILSEVHFSFVVDKDSIGIVVAQSAVTRFEDILNNKSAPNSFSILENHMNNRGSNSSSVSYVGNVAGASDNDSTLIQQLFTNEFLSMDLDGDGKAEPITLMIKREDLDGNEETGDSYTYKALFGISRTVHGVEFTLYITAEGFDKNTLNVYAVTYTIFPGSKEWVQVVPLTQGTATANRYTIGFGGNNSFNTDTWKSLDGKTMDTLTKDSINAMQR